MSKDRKGNDIAGEVCLLVSWVLVGRQRVMKEMHHYVCHPHHAAVVFLPHVKTATL